MNPYQTAHREQSDLGPYCLQYRLLINVYKQMREQMTIGINGGKGLIRGLMIQSSICLVPKNNITFLLQTF